MSYPTEVLVTFICLGRRVLSSDGACISVQTERESSGVSEKMF